MTRNNDSCRDDGDCDGDGDDEDDEDDTLFNNYTGEKVTGGRKASLFVQTEFQINPRSREIYTWPLG